MATLRRSGIAATVQAECECRLLFRIVLSSLQAEALYDRLQYIACNTSPKWGGGEGCCALSTLVDKLVGGYACRRRCDGRRIRLSIRLPKSQADERRGRRRQFMLDFFFL